MLALLDLFLLSLLDQFFLVLLDQFFSALRNRLFLVLCNRFFLGLYNRFFLVLGNRFFLGLCNRIFLDLCNRFCLCKILGFSLIIERLNCNQLTEPNFNRTESYFYVACTDTVNFGSNAVEVLPDVLLVLLTNV